MGCAASTVQPEEKPAVKPHAKSASKSDSSIHAKSEPKRFVRMVLLGPGESGKSTFFKQLKILQLTEGWTESERKMWTSAVHANVASQMGILVRTHLEEEMTYEDDSLKDVAVKYLDEVAKGEWTANLGQWTGLLWADPSIKCIYNERDRLFTLNDGAGFLFDAVHRINEPGYIPTPQDLLRVRIRSSGVEQAEYVYKETKFKVYDVGGQIPERRRWAKLLNVSTAVIFFASLSEYDQRLREDRSRWRQADTLELWREILQLSELAHKPIILMLNKVDIFKQKIQKKGIDCFWTDYKGPAGDWEPAADYIRNQFLQRVVSPKDQPVVVHFLCAVDTSHVEQIWTGLRDVLLKKAVMELMDSCMT